MYGEIRVNTKELIKELDPDYVECIWCERLVHKNTTKDINDTRLPMCSNRSECIHYKWNNPESS